MRSGRVWNRCCRRRSPVGRMIAGSSMAFCGCSTAWRDLPRRYGPVGTVSSRFYRWRRSGVWHRVLEALQADAEGRVGWELHFLDSTVVPARRRGAPGGARTRRRGRGAGPLARRLHDPCALRGLRQAGHLRADRWSGARQPAGDSADRPRRDPPHRPAKLAGDKGYSSRSIRLARGITPVIPTKSAASPTSTARRTGNATSSSG